jgi:pimeloyl-ACP methyl ester carboxylesterase
MGFLKTPRGLAIAVPALLLVGLAALLWLRVGQVTTPDRPLEASMFLANSLGKVEAVRFPATDGIELTGWLAPGRPGYPAIILAHDFGATKAALLNVALPLQQAGFHVLALDFRGHGGSAGGRSTLGLLEKRDVIGAVDFLRRQRGVETGRMGVLGVGMGAHAAALAALDRPALRVLVLDAVYPDVDYAVVRRVYQGWPFGVAHLGFFPSLVFGLRNGTGRSSERAADVIPSLASRQVLLVAPAGDAALAAEIDSIYRAIPKSRDASEGNLVALPATLASGLYGADLERYTGRVVEFFSMRLAPRT